MKLLIDIPDKLKTEVYDHGLFLCPNDKISLVNAINHGIPQESCDVPDTNVGDIISKPRIFHTSRGLRHSGENFKEVNMYHPIIDLIRNELEERKITRAEFADMIGYSLSNMHNWLTGRCIPKFTAIEDMLNALDYRLVVIKKEGEDV